MSRARQIINYDDESVMISKEALVLITKATEFFIQDLAGVNAINAKFSKRKTLQVSDIVTAANVNDRFHFIKDCKLPILGSGSSTLGKTGLGQ